MKKLTPEQKDELINYISGFVTDDKRKRIDQILERCTRYLTVVLEDIYQIHNASAVVRSCECFGVQALHVIEERNVFRINPDITVGASKWISIKRYSSGDGAATQTCLEGLKARDYRIGAMIPRKDATPIKELSLDQKVALCFGTEEDGLSEGAHSLADIFVAIPMVGFTQSFNLSVSVALSLFALTDRLYGSRINWHLSENEKRDVKIEWLSKAASHGDELVKGFLNERGLNVTG
ncbi:MAG: RNA methyltransferase [Gammaproteobacteria bacterium]